jgi:vacuolar protein sorting-associated protein 13A/C
MSFRGLKIAYTDYPQYYEASLDCKWIQIDNQRFGNTYPMVLYPTVVPKDGKELESHPTLQLSAAILKDEGENLARQLFYPRLAEGCPLNRLFRSATEHGVMFIKYATILLQSMAVEIDQDIVYAFLDFAKFEGASWQEGQQE